MFKKFLIVFLFVLISCSAYSAGGDGGSGGGDKAKPVSQYEIAVKMIKKAKKLEKKIRLIKRKNVTKKLLDIY